MDKVRGSCVPFGLLAGLLISTSTFAEERTIEVTGTFAKAASYAAAAPPAPPSAEPRAPTETRFGITLEDPDRWLEDQQNPAAQDWVKGQADYTRAVLDAIPLRAEVLADLERLEKVTSARLQDVVLMQGERLLIRRQEAGMQTSRLYLREGWDGSDRLLLDPEDWKKKTGNPHAINYAVPSPDGRHAVVGLSDSGSEMAVAYVIELASGKQVGTPITRARFGVSWLPDSSGFFYNRQRDPAPGEPLSEKQLNSQSYLHRLGTDPEKDPLVFGNAYDKTLGIDPAQLPVVMATVGSKHLLGFPYSVDRRLTVFTAALTELGSERIRWRKLISPEDGVSSVAQHGNNLYLLTNALPNRQIERISLDDPLAARTVIVPAGLLPIDAVTVTEDALYYVVKRETGVGSQLHRMPWSSEASSVVDLQGIDTVSTYSTQDGVAGLVVYGGGWSRFPVALRIDAEGKVHETGLQPAPVGIDAEQIVSTIVQVPSHDGVMVPLSIIHRRDIARDGSNPTLLQAYGAYGINIEPGLFPWQFALYERGVVRAACHVRGGGEKGEAWYRAGYQATKPNTWKDLIACGEYLVREGYTASHRMAATGGSAGGIMIGNAMIERPDLFRVMLPMVGVLDSVGAALRDPNGPVNWPEFGDPNTEAGFKALVGMSAYQKVKDGTPFPAVMLYHGYNDPRVAVWHSAKMAARLQRASSSGMPVLLNVDYQAGHGIGSAQASVNALRADILTFMFWQFEMESW
ncbi:MAG: prolyl oligopeptidase family serine peptidase [Halopseudomonas sp.]